MELIAGGVSIFLAAFLGGATGFGFALVATPLLLLIGFPLPFVVTANLSLALVTRVAIVVRFYEDVWPRRVAVPIAPAKSCRSSCVPYPRRRGLAVIPPTA